MLRLTRSHVGMQRQQWYWLCMAETPEELRAFLTAMHLDDTRLCHEHSHREFVRLETRAEVEYAIHQHGAKVVSYDYMVQCMNDKGYAVPFHREEF